MGTNRTKDNNLGGARGLAMSFESLLNSPSPFYWTLEFGGSFLEICILFLECFNQFILGVGCCAGHKPKLSGSQVQHDLLTTPRNGIGTDLAVDAFHFFAAASARVAGAPKDLQGLSRTEFRCLARLELQKRDVPSKAQVLFLLGHCVHLEGDVFKPGMCCLTEPAHLANLVLDDLVLNQKLPERLPDASILHGFLHARACHTSSLPGKQPTLVVEIVDHLLEALVQFADHVLLGHLHVFHDDVSCAACPDPHAVHLACCHTRHAPFK